MNPVERVAVWWGLQVGGCRTEIGDAETEWLERELLREDAKKRFAVSLQSPKALGASTPS